MTRRNPILSILKDMMYLGLETFGRYYSSYRAFVVSNDDPLKIQRVQLQIPQIGGQDTYEYWAIPKGVFSGEGYGMQIIPQVGELVWAEFENGHPEVPIYSLGHFGNKEIPTDDTDLVDPNCYWFKTPYGHTIKINDTKKTISINTNGAELMIDATGKFSIKNGSTDMKTVLINILMTYMKTITVIGEPLSPDSIQNAIDNIKEINTILI